MVLLLRQDVDLLQTRREKAIMIIGCGVFSMLFFNLYTPFNMDRWVDDGGIYQFLRLSTFGLIGSLVLILTQFFLKPWLGVKSLTISGFIGWTLLEIVLLSLLFFLIFGSEDNGFIREYGISIKYTFLGFLIPFGFSIGTIRIFRLQQDVKALARQRVLPDWIDFSDEHGKARFSLRLSDLLFIEAAENYSIIYYNDNGKIKREMIRNSLKALSAQLRDFPVKRCHRSYMVNTGQVKLVKKSGGRATVHFDNCASAIPISRRFVSDFVIHPQIARLVT